MLGPHTSHDKVRLSTDSPHRVVISRRTPEYQYHWFRFYCNSIFFIQFLSVELTCADLVGDKFCTPCLKGWKVKEIPSCP